jgi:hypothetical protein
MIKETIAQDPSTSKEEKKSMNDIVQRFRDFSTEDEEGLEEDDEIEKVIQTIDTKSSEELMALLSDEERQRFQELLKDPNREELKRIFQEEELGDEDPWWMKSENEWQPSMPKEPLPVINTVQDRDKLLWNVVAVM